jgi:hypothetical protein
LPSPRGRHSAMELPREDHIRCAGHRAFCPPDRAGRVCAGAAVRRVARAIHDILVTHTCQSAGL